MTDFSACTILEITAPTCCSCGSTDCQEGNRMGTAILKTSDEKYFYVDFFEDDDNFWNKVIGETYDLSHLREQAYSFEETTFEHLSEGYFSYIFKDK